MVLQNATDIGVTNDLRVRNVNQTLCETAHWFNDRLIRVNTCLSVKRIIIPALYNVLQSTWIKLVKDFRSIERY